MTEIPEDIREKSVRIPVDIMRAAMLARTVPEVARALLAERQSATAAERERCARIVECFVPETQDHLSVQIADICGLIAAAIRGESHDRS